jgi:6-pyruvoyltetrahydropterin/6-carboxytetrahydropterin synthase
MAPAHSYLQREDASMGFASLTRRYRFCAAHRLHTDCLSPQENKTIFGKCNNPNGHGHNYVVFVTVQTPSESDGPVDIARLDNIVAETVVKRFDHHDLNADPLFMNQTTTGENLVVLIWNLLDSQLPGELCKVGVIETRDNYFEYARPIQRSVGTKEVGRG